MVAAIAVVVLLSTIGTFNMLSGTAPTASTHQTAPPASSAEGGKLFHSNVQPPSNDKGVKGVLLDRSGAQKERDLEEREEVRAHIMRHNTIVEPRDSSQQDEQLFEGGSKNMFNREKHFLINHKHKCQLQPSPQIEGVPKLKLVLFLIPSEPHNSLRRKIIRQTWLNTTNMTSSSASANNIVFRNLFVIGKPSYSLSSPDRWESTLELLRWENRMYDDVLVGDFVEDYWNLTYKTMLGITWAHFYCGRAADFVFKIDDDVLVLQNKLFPLLDSFPTHDFFGGLCMKKGKPHRNKKSKWYISKLEFPRYRYPPFCYGPSYFFSSDLLPHIFNATLHVNFFKLEDVYMGLCIEHAGKSVQTIKGVSNVSPKYTYCAYKDLAIIHGIEPTKWSMYFRDMAKRAPQNIICPKKVHKRTASQS